MRLWRSAPGKVIYLTYLLYVRGSGATGVNTLTTPGGAIKEKGLSSKFIILLICYC